MAIRINLSTISALQCSRTLCTSSSPERGRATPTPWAPTPRKAQVLGQVRHCGHGQLPWGHAKLHPEADVENSVFFSSFLFHKVDMNLMNSGIF